MQQPFYGTPGNQLYDVKLYDVKYENIPEIFKKEDYFDEDGTRSMLIDEILFFSPNKSDCEIYLASNKYNL